MRRRRRCICHIQEESIRHRMNYMKKKLTTASFLDYHAVTFESKQKFRLDRKKEK